MLIPAEPLSDLVNRSDGLSCKPKNCACTALRVSSPRNKLTLDCMTASTSLSDGAAGLPSERVEYLWPNREEEILDLLHRNRGRNREISIEGRTRTKRKICDWMDNRGESQRVARLTLVTSWGVLVSGILSFAIWDAVFNCLFFWYPTHPWGWA